MPKTIAPKNLFSKVAIHGLFFVAAGLVTNSACANAENPQALQAKQPATYGTPVSAVPTIQAGVSETKTTLVAPSTAPTTRSATTPAQSIAPQSVPERRRNLRRSGESLAGRSSKAKQIKSPAGQLSSLTGGRPLSNVLGALSIVLGVFFLLAWMMKRWTPKHATQLPSDVIEVLGRSPLTSKQTMHLVKLGNRLLLVTVTPDGTETLSEITDPDEVTRLVALCGKQKPNAANKTFQKAFEDLTKERTRGFIGQHAPS